MQSKYDFLMYERAGYVVLDPLGTAVALLLVVMIAVAVANTRLPHRLKQLIYAALALRVVGAVARYFVLFAVYGGSGDARHYYSRGLRYAEALWQLDPGPLFDPANWWNGRWWGTQFVYFPSTLTGMFTGASMPGGFIVFSLFAFAGLWAFVVAYRRTYPHASASKYARWIWFFPALWFWPSSIGKEAIILLGLGLTVAGYVGRRGRINWLLLLPGLFFVFGVRPQVAAVLIVSLIAAHWFSLVRDRWTLRSMMQAVVLIVGGLAGLYVSLSYAGIGGFDPDGVVTYVEDNNARVVGGGSAIDAPPVGISGIPLALVNILLRPFPWEASSLTVLITCVEIMGFWTIAWFRRRTLLDSLRNWRGDRLLRLAVPFILLYSIALGMVLGNMAIIARQRIFLFPFLFLLLEAAPRTAVRNARGTGTGARSDVRGRPAPALTGARS